MHFDLILSGSSEEHRETFIVDLLDRTASGSRQTAKGKKLNVDVRDLEANKR